MNARHSLLLMIVIAFAASTVGALGAPTGDNELDQQLRTAYIQTDFGPSTYKSKLQLQNDTGNSVRFVLGANVGEKKSVNVRLIRESGAINFELNSGSISPVWSQTAITYRWGYFYLGPVLTSVAMETTKNSAPLFTVTGTGYGGAAGTLIPLTRSSHLYLDVIQGMVSQIQEKDQKDVLFGPRLNIDLGSKIALTKRGGIAFMLGYRYMRHTITMDGTANAELMTTTYLGLSFGFDF